MELKMDDVEEYKAKLLNAVEQGKSVMQEVIVQAKQKLNEMPDLKRTLDEIPAIKQRIKDSPEIQLYIAAAIVVLTMLLSFLLHLFKRKKPNTIVLAGLNGSGKTVLFYQLKDGSSHEGTVTSMDPNEGTFVLHSEATKRGKIKPVHLVDVPGHSRLRPKLDEYMPQAAGVVFVVDSVEFLPNCRAVAEYLYDILTKASVIKKRIPLLIVCNKSDKVTAHSKDFIRKQLEKEIDKLRASRTVISDADITSEFTLGESGHPFAFSQCHNKVSLADASGLKGKISPVEEFIREHVKP